MAHCHKRQQEQTTSGIKERIMNSIKEMPSRFKEAPRRQRYGAAVGAGLLGALGLDAILGGTPEQEQYQ